MSFATRAATAADICAIGRINASNPDDASHWQFPTWRDHAAEATGPHARALAPLFQSAQFLFRVAESNGEVVGYTCIQKRLEVADEGVKAVDIGTAYTADEVSAALGDLAPKPDVPPTSLFKIVPSTESRLAAMRSIRAFQDPEPCTQQPSYQVLLLCISPSHQRRGIGSALIRWALEQGVADELPVFVTGETMAVAVYGRLGFQEIEGTWWGLDCEAARVARREDGGWEKGEDGVAGAQMVFVPPGREVEARGRVYRGVVRRL